jgi:hypothetical protein
VNARQKELRRYSEVFKGVADDSLYGRAGPTRAEIEGAAADADTIDVIRQLPEGFTIYVFDKGCVIEQRNHPALMNQGGLYAHFYHIQRQSLPRRSSFPLQAVREPGLGDLTNFHASSFTARPQAGH